MSRASSTRSEIDSATSSAKGQRPAEDAGVAGVRAAVQDPFAEASSLLVHLVIDKVPPIKHVLDEVTLDEGAAMALAQQWSEEFPSALREQRDALASARESISQNWEGEGASKTYQDRQRELEDLADSLAAACEGAGFLTSAVNELMVGVREQIIEWIAQLVSMLMKRLIAVVATFWIPIVGEIIEAEFIVEGIARVVATIARITSLISRVEGILGQMSSVAQVLGGATQQVQELGSALGEVPQGSGASPLRALGPAGSVRKGGPTGSHGPVVRSAVPNRGKSPGGSTHTQGAGTGTRGLGPQTRSQTGATPSSSSGTHPQGGAVNAATNSRGLDAGTSGPVTRSQTAEERAQNTEAAQRARLDNITAQVHGELDPAARGRRTTATLLTKEGRVIVAGGTQKLTPLQQEAAKNMGAEVAHPTARPIDIAALDKAERGPYHAEQTALAHAAENSLTPSMFRTSTQICQRSKVTQSCEDAIIGYGGTIHDDRKGATF